MNDKIIEMYSIKYIFSIFMALAGVALLGCTDQTGFYGDSGATEGEPVLVDLKLDVDDVTIASRSVLDDKTVRTLWWQHSMRPTADSQARASMVRVISIKFRLMIIIL